MDEITSQQWTDALLELRNTRQSQVTSNVSEKGSAFQPKEFFEQAVNSLDQVLERWVQFEQESWERRPGGPPQKTEPLNEEMESVIDFELEALRRDISWVGPELRWDEKEIAEAEKKFLSVVDELRKKYQLKLGSSLTNGHKKQAVADVPLAAAPVEVKKNLSFSSSGSSVGLLGMFLFGILLGGGPAFYFWDVAKKKDKEHQESANKLREEQKNFQDSVTLLQGIFYDLAIGKAKSLPELEKDIRRIRDDFAVRRRDLEDEFSDKRESTLRKVSIERLDEALQKLENEKKDRLDSINAQETKVLEPLLRQQQTLKELMGR